jgi:hypothetical protein
MDEPSVAGGDNEDIGATDFNRQIASAPMTHGDGAVLSYQQNLDRLADDI